MSEINEHDGNERDRAAPAAPVGRDTAATAGAPGDASVGPMRCLSTTWRLRTDDPAVAASVRTLYGACADPRSDPLHELAVLGSPGGGVSLSLDGQTLLEGVARGHAVAHLVFAINQLVVHAATDRVLVHAAAAEHDGRVILLPGPRGAGKSTLVSVLVRSGLAYISDETVALDPDTLTADVYPKPLSLKRESWSALPDLAPLADQEAAAAVGEWLVAPTALGPGAVATAPTGGVGVVVFPSFRRGASTTLASLSAGEAVLRLAGTVTNLDRLGEFALGTIARVCRGARSYLLEYGDPAPACELVVALVHDASSVAVASGADRDDAPAVTAPSVRSGDVPVRNETVEWIDVDGEIVAHDRARARLHHLNRTCAQAWHACDGRRTVAQISAAVAAGAPGDGDDRSVDVARALGALVDAGLLGLDEPR